jgi:hypothetical protein
MTTIVDYGFFKPIEEEDTPDNPGPHLLRYLNDKGEDWYDIRRGLTEWEANTGKFVSAIFGAWALVDEDGVITNVEYDPARLAPLNRRVLGIDAKWKDIRPGTIYREGNLVDGPPLPWMEKKLP